MHPKNAAQPEKSVLDEIDEWFAQRAAERRAVERARIEEGRRRVFEANASGKPLPTSQAWEFLRGNLSAPPTPGM